MRSWKLDGLIEKFTELDWDTMANFAFAVEFRPGQGPDEEKLYLAVFKKVFPDIEPDTSNTKIIAVRCCSGCRIQAQC